IPRSSRAILFPYTTLFRSDVSEKFIEALTKSLLKRKKGKPMRLLYDVDMPQDMLSIITRQLNLKAESLIPGNRYQNFKDFIKFPDRKSTRLNSSHVKISYA